VSVVQPDTDRFLALVCRELGASEAFIVPSKLPDAPGESEKEPDRSDDDHELRSRLAAGGTVVVRFADAIRDRPAKQRRLEILASTFDPGGSEPPPSPRRSRPPVSSSLRDELLALSNRAAAVNAFVIDANSPVVWGAARPEDVAVEPAPASSPRMAQQAEEGRVSEGRAVSLRTLLAVRSLPEIAALRKGKHVRCVNGGGPTPLVAHSFAGIYLLVVVFDAPFDELRAQRAVLDALPRVERLVLALPPHDPDPTQGAGAIAIRRPRRR